MTIMERVYLSYALGGAPFNLIYCSDDNPDGDFVGIGPQHVNKSLAAWKLEQSRADELLAGISSLDEAREGNKRSVRWNLVKLIQEYARHKGHADLLRVRIDGSTGE